MIQIDKSWSFWLMAASGHRRAYFAKIKNIPDNHDASYSRHIDGYGQKLLEADGYERQETYLTTSRPPLAAASMAMASSCLRLMAGRGKKHS